MLLVHRRSPASVIENLQFKWTEGKPRFKRVVGKPLDVSYADEEEDCCSIPDEKS